MDSKKKGGDKAVIGWAGKDNEGYLRPRERLRSSEEARDVKAGRSGNKKALVWWQSTV
jgi:hypothetical protein